jgi:Ca2+-transporting ATPase
VLLAITMATLALLTLSVTWQPAQQLFGFGPLHADDLGTIALAIGLLMAVLISLKPLARKLKAI